MSLFDREMQTYRNNAREPSLNERLCALLSEIVDEYIKSASPIASGTMSSRLAGAGGHRARSPASIRNDLKILEELGYLHQVHAASGGRIPTERAYRRYIERDPDPTFVAGLIDDLQALSNLITKIERKLSGVDMGRADGMIGTLMPKPMRDDSSRKINFQKLFEEPELQMSAIYLIIKEKIDNGKM